MKKNEAGSSVSLSAHDDPGQRVLAEWARGEGLVPENIGMGRPPELWRGKDGVLRLSFGDLLLDESGSSIPCWHEEGNGPHIAARWVTKRVESLPPGVEL